MKFQDSRDMPSEIGVTYTLGSSVPAWRMAPAQPSRWSSDPSLKH